MTCLSKVRAALNAMTASERKLAQLVMDDPQVVIHQPAKAIAEACGTSPASVVRFARMLGFPSLREMKEDLRLDLMQKAASDTRSAINLEDDLMSVAAGLHNKIVSGMQTTLNMQTAESVQRAVDAIDRAETLYLYGVGASSLPALDMQQKMARVNRRAIYREDHDVGILDSLYMTSRDALIAFSYSGRTREVNVAVRNAAERGVHCIAITKFGRSPLSALATITLPLPENEAEVRYAAVQSKYESFLLVDLLYAGYIQRHKEHVEDQIERTRAVIRQLKDKAE